MNPKPALNTAVVTLSGLLVGVALVARAYVVQHLFRAQPDANTLFLGAAIGGSLAFATYLEWIGLFPSFVAIGGIASMCWGTLNGCDGTIIGFPLLGVTFGASLGLRIDHDRRKWKREQLDSEVET